MIWQELPFKFEVNFGDLSLGGVYMMTMDTGHYYIGSTKNFKTRISCHKTSFRKNYPDNERMRVLAANCKSIRFDVLELIKDPSMLKQRENFYLSSKWGDPLLINSNKAKDEKSRWKAGTVTKKKKNTSDKGRPAFYKKVINTITGEVYNSVYDLSVQTGRPVKQYVKKLNGERNNNTPYKYLDGVRHVAYKSEGYIDKGACPGGVQTIKKAVNQFDIDGNLIEVHTSTRAAAKKLGTKDRYIRWVARGTYRQWHGFVFKYV
jgi:hypothetical protein